jgi:uncharacterized protein (DUF58 family)
LKSGLTDSAFIRKLELLSLLTRKVLAGDLKSDRKSRKKGSGIHFADVAEYKFGDDLRNVDWNIYARFEQMVVKLYEVEEDARIVVLFDLSPSMRAKLEYAKRITAAIAYIALNNQDRLSIHSLSDSLGTLLPPSHGRSRIFPMLEALDTASCSGVDTRLLACVRQLQARIKRPGVCVIVSDFLLREGYAEALRFLRWSKHEVFLVHVVEPEEQVCRLRGDVRLCCVETGAVRDLTIGEEEGQKFAAAMTEWNRALRLECARNEIGYAMAGTEVPFETVQEILRRGGLIA